MLLLERSGQMLEVTNDDEWAAVKPLIQRVMEARLAVFAGMGRGMMGGPGRGGPGGGAGAQARRGGDRPDMFGQTMPEAEALQKAINDKRFSAG